MARQTGFCSSIRKYEFWINILVQIIFVVGLTAYLNYRITTLQANLQKEISLELHDYDQMRQISTDFSSAAFERLYLMNRWIDLHKNANEASDRSKIQNDYKTSITRWNSERANFESGFDMYFDQQIKPDFAEKIDRPFRDLHAAIYKITSGIGTKAPTPEQIAELDGFRRAIIELTESIYDLHGRLQQQTRKRMKSDTPGQKP